MEKTILDVPEIRNIIFSNISKGEDLKAISAVSRSWRSSILAIWNDLCEKLFSQEIPMRILHPNFDIGNLSLLNYWPFKDGNCYDVAGGHHGIGYSTRLPNEKSHFFHEQFTRIVVCSPLKIPQYDSHTPFTINLWIKRMGLERGWLFSQGEWIYGISIGILAASENSSPNYSGRLCISVDGITSTGRVDRAFRSKTPVPMNVWSMITLS
jgi:hypothetical protein